MATTQLEKVRSDAMKLSERERAQLAHELVKSLDAPEDPDVADAWDREIARRLDQVDAVVAETLHRDELRRRMEHRLSGR